MQNEINYSALIRYTLSQLKLPEVLFYKVLVIIIKIKLLT